jgi:Beta propeller domain
VSNVSKLTQEQSLILGDAGSSSDTLWNPKAFVYYKEKNLLLMPAMIMKSANDKNDPYRSSSAFQ